jgi:calcineurin-like phosphoesterase family protein
VASGRGRNQAMVERIERTPVAYPFRFAFAGDSGAWPDPTADAIFSQLVRQVAALDPPALFFANLGDFAGPGTPERHDHYLRLAEPLPIAKLCVVGNHDLDDPAGQETFARIHGPANFTFAYGHTRFVALDGAPGAVGEVVIEQPAEGPREEALAFLDATLRDADEPNRIVLTHMPPSMGGHYAPHDDWGFTHFEDEFFALLEQHAVKLVCCAHGLAFDEHVHRGVRVVMSGGGGTGLASDFRGITTDGKGRPEDRGALFHVVVVEVSAAGEVTGGAIQAFAERDAPPRIAFGP